MAQDDREPALRIRVSFGSAGMMGPGKAALLERIDETGSIAAAGRAMGMSYKRAWQLVETMNAMFRDPLVARSRGGAAGGGATLTETGAEVLARYRRLERNACLVTAEDMDGIRALLRREGGNGA